MRRSLFNLRLKFPQLLFKLLMSCLNLKIKIFICFDLKLKNMREIIALMYLRVKLIDQDLVPVSVIYEASLLLLVVKYIIFIIK